MGDRAEGFCGVLYLLPWRWALVGAGDVLTALAAGLETRWPGLGDLARK